MHTLQHEIATPPRTPGTGGPETGGPGAEELRRSQAPRLRFGAQRKSLTRLHDEDAQQGVVRENVKIPRRLLACS